MSSLPPTSEQSISSSPGEQSALPLVFLGLGSNLGDRAVHLRAALEALVAAFQVERVSSIYETLPQLVSDQPRYYNLVCAGHTQLAPHDLLRFLKNLEQRLGRTPTYRYGPREIDLDLLLYGNERIRTPDLTVPHPRMAERGFVLIPLAEIAPQVVHPRLKRTMRDLAAAVADQGVEKLALDC